MNPDRPDMQSDQILIIKTIEKDSHAIVEIGGRLYRTHYLADKNNPGDQPLCPGDCLKVMHVNTVGWNTTTHTERVTSQGKRMATTLCFRNTKRFLSRDNPGARLHIDQPLLR